MKRSPRAAVTAFICMLAMGWATEASAIDLPCLTNCKFSVSGKKGAYVAGIDAAKLAQSRTVQAAADGEAKGVGDHAINKGAFAGGGLRMPQTERALHDLLDQIVDASGKFANLAPQPRNVPIFIVASTEYGPAAQPDNSIVIPLGMLIRATSKDEIAWLLSHEYGHIVLAHFAKDAAAERHKQMLDTLVDVAIQGMDLTQLRAQSNTGGVHLYTVNDPEEARRVGKSETLREDLRTMVQLHGSAVSREQEDRADAAGIDFAMTAGWDAEDGAQAALGRIAEDDARAALMAKSMSDQFKELATVSVSPKAMEGLSRGDISGAFSDWAKSLGRNALQVAAEQAITMMSANHRPTAQRQTGLHAYVHDAYPHIDRELSKAWIEAVKATPEFIEAEHAVNDCDIAKADLAAGKLNEALKTLEPELSTKYADAPFFADTEAEIYVALQNFDRADQFYDRAEGTARVVTPASAPASGRAGSRRRSAAKSASPPPAPVVPAPPTDPLLRQSLTGYEEHVHLLAGHGAFPKAKLKIAEAERRLQDHEPFLPDLIFMAFKGGQSDLYTGYLDECRKVQDDALWERCKVAILDDSQKQALDKLTPDERAKMNRKLERGEEENNRHQMWKHMLDTAGKPQAAT